MATAHDGTTGRLLRRLATDATGDDRARAWAIWPGPLLRLRKSCGTMEAHGTDQGPTPQWKDTPLMAVKRAGGRDYKDCFPSLLALPLTLPFYLFRYYVMGKRYK